MSYSKDMRAFATLLRSDDIDGAIDMIKKNPGFAKTIEKVEGEFVTPLDLAMDYGSAKACDALLTAGARYDLPVGIPPQGGYGSTSLSRVLSEGFKSSKNSDEIIDVFAKHHAQRTLIAQPTSIFLNLKGKSDSLLQKISRNIENFLKNDTTKLGAVITPAAALGAKLGVGAALGAAAGAAATPLVVAAAVAGAAGFIAHKLAEHKNETHIGIRARHEEALETMNRLAKLHVINGRSQVANSDLATQLGERVVNMISEPPKTTKPKIKPSLL